MQRLIIAWAVTFAVVWLSVLGLASRRASQPNPVNGPVRVLSEAAR